MERYEAHALALHHRALQGARVSDHVEVGEERRECVVGEAKGDWVTVVQRVCVHVVVVVVVVMVVVVTKW